MKPPPFVVVTCGPASVPIDAVRRLTNFSTGALGAAMADKLHEAGWSVLCLRGAGSTSAPPGPGIRTVAWETNEELAGLLQRLGRTPAVILHAAALSDFELDSIRQGGGLLGETPAKLDSRAGSLEIVLRPAPKLLSGFRARFPEAFLVGWKYETDPVCAMEKAQRQLDEAALDACVLNGPALGSTLRWLSPDQAPRDFPDRSAFLAHLPHLLSPVSTP